MPQRPQAVTKATKAAVAAIIAITTAVTETKTDTTKVQVVVTNENATTLVFSAKSATSPNPVQM